jgi:hypothetical protein
MEDEVLKRRTWVGALLAFCLRGSVCVEAQAKRPRTSRARAVAAQEAGEADEMSVVVNEGFMNKLLDAVLAQPAPLRFPIAQGVRGCGNDVTLTRATDGARTQVRIGGGQVGATVAFRGSYQTTLLGCVPFEGWADTVFNLSFDRERQAFIARIEVRDMSLKNIPSLLSGSVTGLVQDAINQRVNPVTILRTEQLSTNFPLAQGSSLSLRAKGIRHTVVGKELRLHIAFDIAPGS